MFLPAYPVQGRDEVLLGRHGGLVPDVGVVVEGLEVVEGARLLVDELSQEGGAAPPRRCDQNMSGWRGWYPLAYLASDVHIWEVLLQRKLSPQIIFYSSQAFREICLRRSLGWEKVLAGFNTRFYPNWEKSEEDYGKDCHSRSKIRMKWDLDYDKINLNNIEYWISIFGTTSQLYIWTFSFIQIIIWCSFSSLHFTTLLILGRPIR